MIQYVLMQEGPIKGTAPAGASKEPGSRPNNRFAYEHAALSAIILLSVMLSVAYARLVPWGEAPDEPAHMRYVEYVVRYGSLPPITPVHPYTNEAQQPPLYYGLGAAVIWGYRLATNHHLNSALFADVRFNPDVLDPKKQPVYNVLQHNQAERFPFNAYLLRGLSIVLGVLTTLFTYAAVRKIVPTPAPALIAALVFSFVPQRTFIGMSVSNENLAMLFSAWLVYLIAARFAGSGDSRGTKRGSQAPVIMGTVLALGILSKYTVATFLLPLLWSLWVTRQGSRRGFVRDSLVVLGLTALVAGPFLLFNVYKYGDPVASRAVAAMLPNDSSFRLSDFFWLKDPFRTFLWTSFWGTFGWQRIWMPTGFYLFFDLFTVAGIAGGVRLIVQRGLLPAQKHYCGAIILHLLIIYAVIVVYSIRIIAWQGREMFPALPGVAVLFGVGLSGLFGGRNALSEGILQRREILLRGLVLAGICAALMLANIASINTIRDAFAGVWK